MNFLGLFKKIVFCFLKKVYLYICKDYVYKTVDTEYDVLVSYITEPFYRTNDSVYMNKHQNRNETLIIADILKSLGCSFRFVRLDKCNAKIKDYNVVFGVEPNFNRAALANPLAVKIYYATGAYYVHQNRAIKERTDNFNKRKHTNIPYYRLVSEHDSCEIADYIIQIGSKYTLNSYPSNLLGKIFIIRQSCHDFQFQDFLERKLTTFSTVDFIWMGSEGSILKGFDIVADYFLLHPEYNIHILGNIDKEVFDFYCDRIGNSKNFHLYGFVDLDSDLLEEIALKSSFVIMPSASEGCPGSVLNMMKLGCIPIVTPYAAFDEIETLGVLIDGYSCDDLASAIEKVTTYDITTLKEMIRNCYNYANTNYNKQTFREDMRKCLSQILNAYER